MKTKIKRIIAKVRSMYKYSSEYKALLEFPANVSLRENKETGDLEIESIYFQYYDFLYIYDNKIIYISEYGRKELLLTYNGWDELLSM